MAGKFVQLKLKEGDELSSIPLVLQSEYQWNKTTGLVVKKDAGSDGSHGTTELQLIPEALELLKTIQKPVAVLAICGPYRSGKSFFMSRVIGQQGTFALGHSMEVCTRGIWLSTRALECDEFVLLLLDTEGIGAVEGEGPESITTKLLVTTILLSSFLIYNSMEVPKQGDLQQMSSFAHLSTAIKVSETKASDPKEFQKYFPRFMWLLRDVTNPPMYDDGEDMPLIDYLNDEVLKPTGQKDCDNIIDAICTLFPQPLMCEYLPLPNDDPQELSLEEEENVNEDFVEQLSTVVNGEQGIKACIVPKVGFDKGTKITGSDLADLAKLYLEAINKKGSVPSLEGSWKAVIKLKLTKEAEELVVSYEKEMDAELAGDQPMEESMEETDSKSSSPTLMGLHETVFAKKREALMEKIRQLLPNPAQNESTGQPEESEDVQSVIRQFKCSVAVKENGKVKSGVLYKFITQNAEKSEKLCEELWKQLEQDHKIDDDFARALNQYNAEMCFNVCMKIQDLRETYNAAAIGPAHEMVFSTRNRKWEDRELLLRSIPGPPTHVAVVGKAMDAIKLQWEKPNIHPEAATKYIVEFRKEGAAWLKDTVTTEQWHIVRKLKSNTKYEFRVSSWNDEAEKVKKTIEEMLRGTNQKGLKMGTRLGKLARAALSTIGFLGGTAVAPLLATVGVPAFAMESERKAAAAACVTIPFFATLGAPIVGGKVAYHVIQETGVWGDLEERYVPRKNASSEQGEN